MLKIGITGGIGTGKTTICHIFETLGIPVYYADDRAKWLMSNDESLRNGIIELFGASAYQSNGMLDRTHISKLAFNDSSLLEKLNQLVHPAVALDGERWFSEQQNAPYSIKEAALLIESKSYLKLDKIIVVTAPLEVRIARVMQRDNISREKVEARIAAQMPENEKIKYADFIINNDNQQLLVPQVLTIHKLLS